jgi:gliding motility-associated-like protein
LISIEFNPLPEPPVGPFRSLNCAEPLILIGVTPPPTGIYRWDGPGITNQNRNEPNPWVGEAGWYILEYTNPEGCSVMDSVLVMYPETPYGADVAIDINCSGNHAGNIRITEVYGDTGPYQYFLIGPVNRNNGSGIFNNLPEGEYEIIVMDRYECTWDTLVTLVQPPPILLDLGPDVTISLGQSHHIIPWINIPDHAIADFNWDRTTWLNCPTCFDPTSTPFENITYTLTVFDEYGCFTSDNIRITVDRRANVYIPDIFSPNGDGINDVFMIYADPGVKQILEFKIFDRWGELMFEDENFQPNDPLHGWDGVFRGKRCNPGVFVYYAYVEMINGEVVMLKGDVTLFD